MGDGAGNRDFEPWTSVDPHLIKYDNEPSCSGLRHYDRRTAFSHIKPCGINLREISFFPSPRSSAGDYKSGGCFTTGQPSPAHIILMLRFSNYRTVVQWIMKILCFCFIFAEMRVTLGKVERYKKYLILINMWEISWLAWSHFVRSFLCDQNWIGPGKTDRTYWIERRNLLTMGAAGLSLLVAVFSAIDVQWSSNKHLYICLVCPCFGFFCPLY